MIAALYVESGGVYFGVPDVDPWDVERDARLYAGPHAVVAHPPCSRWCRLAGLVEARWGHKKGEDGGCFAAALASVRKWGGVLEHPAYSDAWKAFGLNRPPGSGGWVNADFQGGWTCHVEQAQYGHPARKRTWLYAHAAALPSLRWGSVDASELTATVSGCDYHNTGQAESRRRIMKAEAARSPKSFRDELLAMARSVETRAA